LDLAESFSAVSLYLVEFLDHGVNEDWEHQVTSVLFETLEIRELVDIDINVHVKIFELHLGKLILYHADVEVNGSLFVSLEPVWSQGTVLDVLEFGELGIDLNSVLFDQVKETISSSQDVGSITVESDHVESPAV
jgi:hypothetical protein